MSAKNQREEWTWLSIFGPKNTNGIPSIPDNSGEDYEVDEEYIEMEPTDTEENEDDDMEEEAEGMLVNYDDDEED